jgi:hypothetical protein
MVHGMCFESEALGDVGMLKEGLTGYRMSWDYMQFMAREVAKDGTAVLVIGMPDNDREVLLRDYPDLGQHQKDMMLLSTVTNQWPACYYAKVLHAAHAHNTPCTMGLRITHRCTMHHTQSPQAPPFTPRTTLPCVLRQGHSRSN